MKTDGISNYREKIVSGPILKTTIWLAWPLIINNLINISYNLADTFWLGKLGKEAIAAPTVSWPLIMLFYAIGIGVSNAGITLISQYVGAGEKEYVRRCAGHLYGFMLILSCSISILGYIFSPTILMLMGVPEDVMSEAVSYIRVIFLGIPFAFTGFAFIAILNGIGDTRTPMLLGITSSIINIIIDPIMIFGLFGLPMLGVLGAALATILARSVISFISLYLLIRGYKGIKIALKDLTVEGWWLKKTLKIGLPITVQHSANSMGFVVMMSIVSRLGTAVIATYGIAIRIIDVIQAFTWGIMRATSIMIGQNIGGDLYDRAGKIAYKNILLTFIVLSVGAVVLLIFREPTFHVFIDDPSVTSEGSRLMSIFIPSIPFFGMFFVGGAVAYGSGHPVTYMAIGIVRLWLLRILMSYLLAFVMGMGPTGVWVAMSTSNIGAGIMAIAWVAQGSWKKKVIEVPAKVRYEAVSDQSS